MRKHLGLLLSAFSFILSIHPASATILPNNGSLGDQQIIGGNYHGIPNYFDPGIRCIQVDERQDVEVIHNESAAVVTTTSVDYNTLEKELGSNVSVGGSTPFGDPIALQVNFLKNAQETNNTIVFAYRTVVNTGSVILKGPHKLTSEAQKSLLVSPAEFERYCGDQFIYQLDKGARAYVAVKVELESESQKRLIESEVGGAVVDIFSISVQIKKLKQKYGLTGNITIAGYQEGGFAARINSIFGTGEGMGQCNGSNFAKCEVLLKEAVNYFAHDFADQFDQYFRSGGGVRPGSTFPVPGGVVTLPPTAKTLSYSAQSYCKLAAPDRPAQLNCPSLDTSLQISELSTMQNQLQAELRRIQDIKNTDVALAPDYLTAINAYEKELQAGTAFVTNAFMSCNRDPWSCETTTRETRKLIPVIRASLLATVRKDERVQICWDTGENNEVSNFKVKLTEKGQDLKTFKVFGEPGLSQKECVKFNAPEVTDHEIDGLELQIQMVKEENKSCSMRVEKKFAEWANWDLKAVEVTKLSNGKKYYFSGKKFALRPKCVPEIDRNDYLPWVKLSPVLDP